MNISLSFTHSPTQAPPHCRVSISHDGVKSEKDLLTLGGSSHLKRCHQKSNSMYERHLDIFRLGVCV